jgi:hypothetical protein
MPQGIAPGAGSVPRHQGLKDRMCLELLGQWIAARQLLRRFRVPSAHKLPYYWLAQSAATSFGTAAGVAIRRGIHYRPDLEATSSARNCTSSAWMKVRP